MNGSVSGSESGRVWLGDTPLHAAASVPRGSFVSLEGEPFYKIANYDRMPPFFLTVVSDADHWLFVSSHGALTAGRRDADHALFPYTTDDKIHDGFGRTGCRTILLLEREGRTSLWEPFVPDQAGVYSVERSIYKNVTGDVLVFEEVNHSLAATFRYSWSSSERFGFVRRAALTNHGAGPARVRVLDGLLDVLPSGVQSHMQTSFSTLVDAYKMSELVPEVGLALFRLGSIPADQPEPSEALLATVAWCDGLAGGRRLLSTRQLEAFRRGRPIAEESAARGGRCAFFVQAELELRAGAAERWSIVADVHQDPADVARLTSFLRQEGRKEAALAEDVARGTANLVRLVAAADGLQMTESPLEGARHLANTLFNIMRGGVFTEGYRLRGSDLATFVGELAPRVAGRHAQLLSELPRRIDLGEARALARATQDPDLERLFLEYLPLRFSRRHGDPSRPWNRFSIRAPSASDESIGYEGNWRDIFQNWEALCFSFPAFVIGAVAKFVNASTADGYNPYRVTRAGFEWEVPDPHDAWANIGYWGDHQVIYLLRLLELAQRHYPGVLGELLEREVFVYADVPYSMRPLAALLADPRDAVVYDTARAAAIARRVSDEGAEGKLARDRSGAVHRVGLAEKLLVPMLVKLSNLVPEGGIWMNTQRPEWNDANNALVGYGVSVVTLCQLRRGLVFFADLAGDAQRELSLSEEVTTLLERLESVFARHAPLLEGRLSNGERRAVLDALGQAGSEHRTALYEHGFSGARRAVASSELVSFCRLALRWVEHSIRANRREDGLYHAYNIMDPESRSTPSSEGEIALRRLDEMLEGQVAVLNSGCLEPREALSVLAALRASRLYREDQQSYLLYPDRQLPRFADKNRIPAGAVERSPLLSALAADGNEEVVIVDVDGAAHFHADLRNARVLGEVLDRLQNGPYTNLVTAEREALLALYESTFDHRSFTGRSGTFFGYEGLGSIYWHQVSKLLLAVQAAFQDALRSGAPGDVSNQLAECYFDVRSGLGTSKSPEHYGAFPTDPYSHTPAHKGAQQPGLTGQVKEDFLARMGELGVWARGGRVAFRPALFRPSERRTSAGTFEFVDVAGATGSLDVEPGSVAFTYCQVPVVLHVSADARIRCTRADATTFEVQGRELDRETSAQLFGRTGDLVRIDVFTDEWFGESSSGPGCSP